MLLDSRLVDNTVEGPEGEDEVERILGDLARDVGKTDEKEKEEYLNRVREQPFVVESVDFPGQQFIDIQHIQSKVLIRINTRHPATWRSARPIGRERAVTLGAVEVPSKELL